MNSFTEVVIMNRIVYMDYQSTTPCDTRVFGVMKPYFCEEFGNPHSSTHIMGQVARNAIEEARIKVANIISAPKESDIIFTSGATESNNLAIQGVAKNYKDKGNRILYSAIEHKCVIDTCLAMKKEGFDVHEIPVLKNGILDIDAFKKLINDQTILVSVMAVNNEIGTIQPIDEIGAICKKHGALFHCDAAQAIGKIDINVVSSEIDLLSISGHKIYGPKGIGALYIRSNPKVRLFPLTFGGRQEGKVRSGTLPTPLCVGFGVACTIAMEEMHDENLRLTKFKEYFIDKLFQSLEKISLNGDPQKRIPGCLNFSFYGVEGEGIMLGMKDVCVSSGSACTSESLRSSYVLKAIDVCDDIAHSSIRIGFGRQTTFEEVEYVALRIVESVNRLRNMSPLWP